MENLFCEEPKLRRTWAEIDLDAAKSNFLKLKQKANGKLACAVIKANAYGHGAVRLAELYSSLGVDFLAVSNMEEALELRRAKIESPILILGYVSPECATVAAKNDITLALYSLPFAKALSDAAVSGKVQVKVHLKFDTGMGRIGFSTEEDGENSLSAAALAASLPALSVEGAFTHFAVADGGACEEFEKYTKEQSDRFEKAVRYLTSRGVSLSVCHVSNSAAVLDHPELARDMVRLGISLYGLAPSFDVKCDLALEPVMTLKSVISHIKTVEEGTSVSYGRTFIAKRKMRIATVPVGYADGIFRSSSDRGAYLTVNGRRAEILGRICMDQLMIDVTDINCSPFDEVVIFGKGAAESADSLAAKNSTIGYEQVCAISRRVPRVYITNGKAVDVVNYLE